MYRMVIPLIDNIIEIYEGEKGRIKWEEKADTLYSHKPLSHVEGFKVEGETIGSLVWVEDIEKRYVLIHEVCHACHHALTGVSALEEEEFSARVYEYAIEQALNYRDKKVKNDD